MTPFLSIVTLGLKNAADIRHSLFRTGQALLENHPYIAQLKFNLLYLPHTAKGHIYKVLLAAEGDALNLRVAEEGADMQHTLEEALKNMRNELEPHDSDFPQAA